MKKVWSYFRFCLLLIAYVSTAQDANLDSLKNALNLQQGTEKLNTLLAISYYSYEYDIKAAHQYAMIALDMARKLKQAKQEKFATSLIGEYHYNINEFQRARSYFLQADRIKASGAEVYIGYNYVLWGSTYRLESQIDSARFYFAKALPLLEKGEDYNLLHYGYVSYAGFLMDQYQLAEARRVLGKARVLAEQNRHITNLADVMIEQGRLENLSDEYNKARDLLMRADSLIPGTGYSYLRLICVYNEGYAEYNLGNYFKAVVHLKEILSKPEVEQYEDIKANITALVGRIYLERGEFDLASRSYFDAVKVMERLNMRRELGHTYSDIAWLYFKQFNDAEVQVFVNKALEIGTKIRDEIGVSRALSIQGSLFTSTGKFQDAIRVHEKALEIRQRLQSRAGITDTYYNLSTAYTKMGQLEQAMYYAKQCLMMDTQMGNVVNLGMSHKRIASIYLAQGDYMQAKTFLHKADSCSRYTTSLELKRDIYLLYADLYEKNGELKKANQYLRTAISANDSLYKMVNLGKTAEIRGLFDLENIELKSRQREQELALERFEMENQRKFYFYAKVVSFIASILLVIIAFLYHTSRKNNLKLLAEIAERKKAEEQMINSQVKLEEAQSLAQVGSWEFYLETSDLYWSKETYRIFELEGHPSETLYQAWRSKCQPDDFLVLEEAFNNTIVTGTPFHVEHRLLCNDGTVKYISCIGEAIKSKSGKIIGLKGTDQDVSLQKQAALAKSDFLSSMSHEIRTPINGVVGIANLLMEEKLSDVQREYVNTLKFSAQHLSSILSDILDFSKIESGNLVLEKVPFNLREVTYNVFKLFENKAKEKQIQYTLEPDPAMGYLLLGDYVRLSQILSNLLSNAIKFTEKGSVTLRYVATASTETSVHVVFSVHDTGIGIETANVERIFDNFSQADASITRKYGGTGLGLAITKKLVALQSGKISVESRIGQGSVFAVELDFDKYSKPDKDSKLALPDAKLQGQLSGMKVLVAEDNKVNVLVLTPLLKKWGVAYTVANDGMEAIDLVSKADFDAVIMDIQMPNVDGREATSVIRQSADNQKRQVPIIAFTAEASLESQQELLQSGFNDCLIKPFQPETLFQTLQKYYTQVENG